MGKIELVCVQCGVSFMRYPSNEKQRIEAGQSGPYCSRKCSHESTQNRVTLTCQECGTVFERVESSEKQRIARGSSGPYCSVQCRGLATRSRVKLECTECGDVFERRTSEVKTLRKRGGTPYCSRECYAASNKKNAVERFMSKWEYRQGCWIWIGARDPLGYGRFRGPSGDSMLAHRYAFRVFWGETPDNELHHVCETPSCVFPVHLMDLTRREHMKVDDRLSKLEEPA